MLGWQRRVVMVMVMVMGLHAFTLSHFHTLTYRVAKMAGHTLSKRHFLGLELVRAVGVFAFLAADLDAALRWDRER